MAGRHGRAAALLGALGLTLALGSGCDFLKSKPKAFGESCTEAKECESGECATYGSFCSKGCTYDSECGAGYVCRARDDGAGSLCSKAQGTAPNAACGVPAECDHGHCLKRVGQQDQPGICSLQCQTANDCPDGMKICESISDSGAVKFCLPGGATAAADKPVFVAPRPAPKTQPTTTATVTQTQTSKGGLGDPGLGKPDAGTGTPDAGTATGTPDAGTTTGTPDAGTSKAPPPILKLPGKKK
jgi:hypothetical protein